LSRSATSLRSLSVRRRAHQTTTRHTTTTAITMAACSSSLRLGLRLCASRSAAPTTQLFRPCRQSTRIAARRAAITVPSRRALSTTSAVQKRQKDADEDAEEYDDEDTDAATSGSSAVPDAEDDFIASRLASMGPIENNEMERLGLEIVRIRGEATRQSAVRKPNEFWYDVPGTESDLVLDDQHESDDNDIEDISTPGHAKFEQFREYREYARLAAWQLPLLSKLAKPFEPPTAEEPLRFRYTTYMGETHPAENKVVVEFAPRDLPLTEPQQLKLKKLLGPRYNPETEIAKISSEQYEHQAQNKRYLGDLVDKLIAQAKDSTDMFEDIPLDTRHHKFKPKIKFPVEWRMSEERRKFIDDTREKSLLLDQAKTEEGTMVDGKKLIEESFIAREKQLAQERLKQREALPAYAVRGGGGAGRRPGPRF